MASQNILYERPTILEATSGNAQAITDSRMMANDTEPDRDGPFGGGGNEPGSVSDLAAQIWSLEARAAACDVEAMNTHDAECNENYMHNPESRKLRDEARKLKRRRANLAAARDMREWNDTQHDVNFAGRRGV